MNQQAIIAGVVIFALIVVGMFTFTYLKKQELRDTPPVVTEEPQDESPLTPYGIDRIDGTHYFIDGTHTVVGEIVMPTPCDLLEVEAIVRESMPEQIVLAFNVINTAETCAQIMTPQRFSVSAVASEGATFEATFKGVSVPLNLTPAPAGAVPEEFEVYIKG